MTLAEFKAWLDGYLDGKDGLSADQVATVREKLGMTFGDFPTQMPLQPAVPILPNIIGPYWSPTIPTYVPRFGEITCQNDATFTANSTALAN